VPSKNWSCARGEHPNRIDDRVEPEHPDCSRLRLEQSQDVFDGGRFADAVAADQPEHAAARDRERKIIEGRLGAELPGDAADLDDGGYMRLFLVDG
jgi:hypothetical protein